MTGIKMQAQLCAKCGQYSGERHKYCLVCVDKLKRGSNEKIHDGTLVDIFSPKTPRKKRTRSFRFGQNLLDNTCTECKKVIERHWNSTLCLACTANKREFQKSSDSSFSLHSIGTHGFRTLGKADLLHALSQSTPSLFTIAKRPDLKCIVCRKRSTKDQGEMCQKCLNRSKQLQPIGRFFKEIAKIVKEGTSVKDEFIKMEPIRGLIQWEISFNARRESLKQLLNDVLIMRPHNKDERLKQEEVTYLLKSFIEQCTIHFERLKIRGVKYENFIH